MAKSNGKLGKLVLGAALMSGAATVSFAGVARAACGASTTSTTTTSSTTATTTSAAIQPSACDTEVMSRVTQSGKWHILGSSTDGCTVSGLKQLGAIAVWPFDPSVNNYTTTDSIAKWQGFWIRK